MSIQHDRHRGRRCAGQAPWNRNLRRETANRVARLANGFQGSGMAPATFGVCDLHEGNQAPVEASQVRSLFGKLPSDLDSRLASPAKIRAYAPRKTTGKFDGVRRFNAPAKLFVRTARRPPDRYPPCRAIRVFPARLSRLTSPSPRKRASSLERNFPAQAGFFIGKPSPANRESALRLVPAAIPNCLSSSRGKHR